MIQHRMSGTGLSSRFWSSQDGHSKPEPKQKRERAEDVAVCLSCTRKKCCGTQECFRKSKVVGVSENEENP